MIVGACFNVSNVISLPIDLILVHQLSFFITSNSRCPSGVNLYPVLYLYK